MKVDTRQYGESLEAAFVAGLRSPQELVSGLVQLLEKRGDLKKLESILAYLLKHDAEKKGVVSVTIETAVEANAETKKSLRSEAEALYKGKKIAVHFTLNQDLQSGFRILGEGIALDRSFNSNLSTLRKKLISH